MDLLFGPSHAVLDHAQDVFLPGGRTIHRHADLCGGCGGMLDGGGALQVTRDEDGCAALVCLKRLGNAYSLVLLFLLTSISAHPKVY
jgi:hypothetical protein